MAKAPEFMLLQRYRDGSHRVFASSLHIQDVGLYYSKTLEADTIQSDKPLIIRHFFRTIADRKVEVKFDCSGTDRTDAETRADRRSTQHVDSRLSKKIAVSVIRRSPC